MGTTKQAQDPYCELVPVEGCSFKIIHCGACPSGSIVGAPNSFPDPTIQEKWTSRLWALAEVRLVPAAQRLSVAVYYS